MNIHQLSVRYLTEQDRIVLSVNTHDNHAFEIWLTRRMTLALWPQLQQMCVKHFAVPADALSDGFVNLATLDNNIRQVLADSRRKELLETADFQTPYRDTPSVRPLGNQPLLATTIAIKPIESTPGKCEQIALHLTEKLDPQSPVRGVQLMLQAQLVFSLIQMLEQALEHNQWLLRTDVALRATLPSSHLQSPPRSGTESPPAPAGDELETDATQRPRYLN
jgi:hypothetical protein